MNKKLSMEDISVINREGERIKNGLSHLIEAFPNNAKTITGMAEWLSANKSTCQRIVETINKSMDGIQVINSLPGPKGLRGFIALVEKQRVKSTLVKDAKTAVIHFENLIYEYSRSHSGLKNLLKVMNNPTNVNEAKSQQRKSFYEAAKVITGESIEHLFFSCILKESEEDPKYLQQITLNYRGNCHMADKARPITVPIVPCEGEVDIEMPKVISAENNNTKTLPSASVIKEFTSNGILDNIDEFTKGENSLVVPINSYDKKPFDLGVIKNYPREQLGPFYGGKAASCVSMQIRNPCKFLYMACFLDKKYAIKSIANAGIYATNTQLINMIARPESLWFDRFQDQADLLLLNSDTNFSEQLNYPLANELIDSLFSLSNEDVNNYSCYVIRVEYPIWATAYRIYFQYAID